MADCDTRNLTERSWNIQEQKEAGWVWQDLTAKELKAIQMKFEAKTSHEIGDATGFKPSYVRKLFMQSGRLRPAYDDYALYHRGGAKEAVDLVIQRAKNEAPKAIERMVELSKDLQQGPVAYKSNEYLLNQAGLAIEASFRTYFQKTPFEQVQEKINQLSLDVYGKPMYVESQVSHLNLSAEDTKRLLDIAERNSTIYKELEARDGS